MTQKFKGDSIELQMEAAGEPAFDLCSAALDAFYEDAYSSDPFLLMLFDQGRMPFADRVPRDSFVNFIKQAIPNFPYTGTFESYLFILQAVFGAGSGIEFDVPAAGKLSMLVNAATAIDYDAIVQEFVDGAFETHNLITSDGDQLQYSGLSGIDSEAELSQLLAELIPAGIFPDITLVFFSLFNFVVEYDGDTHQLVDHEGNNLVFIET